MRDNAKRVVITGATSMVGAATMRACLAAGDEVFAVIRPGAPRRGRVPISSRVHLVELDISEYGRIPEEVGIGCDVLYHFAWGGRHDEEEEMLHPRMVDCVGHNAPNVGHTLAALGAAHGLGCATFVGAGSQAEYGAMPAGVVVDASTPANPETAYGIAKFAAGRLAALKAADYGIRCIWARIYSVYGEQDREETLVSQLVRKLSANEPVELSDGSQLWDYLHADDAGEALRLLGNADAGSAVFRLASGKSRPLREFVEEARETLGSSSELRFGAAGTDARNLNVSVGDLKAATGWEPAVPFGEGVARIAKSLSGGGLAADLTGGMGLRRFVLEVRHAA